MRGELAALAAAGLWATATILFGQLGKQLPPSVLNLAKGLAALGLVMVTLLVLQRAPAGLDGRAWGLLLVSGGLGIGVGDTLYFTSINRLGPRRALLLETLSPPLGALLALGLLGEVLPLRAWFGIGLTVLGILWVISERVPTGAAMVRPRWQDTIFGVLAALASALAAVLSRAALANTVIDPFWSTLVRLVGGLAMLLILLRCQGPLPTPRQLVPNRRVLGWLLLAAFLGTYLGIYLQQTAFKFAATGVAQALLATSPLFVLPLAAAMGDRVSGRAIGGACLALVGVVLLVTGP
ncbi:MAG: DMT family transporter [Leptolyngbya sp.]|nr:DMT family transporter [Leptolyngbya sp.]